MACALKASEAETKRQQIEPLQMIAAGKADFLTRTAHGVRHLKMFSVDLTFCGKGVEGHWRRGVLDYRIDTLDGICSKCRDLVELAMKEAAACPKQ
jgi:hypothetical protein